MDNPPVKAATIQIVNLGSIEGIAKGQGRCFIVNEEEIAVFRQRDGHLFATQNRCPHRQGPLSEGIIGNGKVVCPLHGHKFDMCTGEGSEAHECVTAFTVREVWGNIILDLKTRTHAKEAAAAQ